MYKYNASCKYIECVNDSDLLTACTSAYHIIVLLGSLIGAVAAIGEGDIILMIVSIIMLAITIISTFIDLCNRDTDSLILKYTCPFISIPLLIMLIMDTVIFILCTFSIPIQWVASVIYGIYNRVSEAKKVRDKNKADKLKAEEDHINKYRLELYHEING